MGGSNGGDGSGHSQSSGLGIALYMLAAWVAVLMGLATARSNVKSERATAPTSQGPNV